jgi:hypothetical protein
MAFKMKGNPYKMGQMATKSALKQTEKPSRKDLSMEDKWKTDLTPEQKERIEERMKEMGKGEAKQPKKREFDVPQGEDARGKSPVKQGIDISDMSDKEKKRISDAFKKTKIRKEGPGKLDKMPKKKGEKKMVKKKKGGKYTPLFAKPDYPDIDGDGNTTESMKKAAADKKSPMKNYKNPQDYKAFNMGNKPTPVKKHKKY